jgi:hypothetical protein
MLREPRCGHRFADAGRPGEQHRPRKPEPGSRESRSVLTLIHNLGQLRECRRGPDQTGSVRERIDIDKAVMPAIIGGHLSTREP